MTMFEIQPMNRSAFLVRSTLAVGAAYGTAAVSPFVGNALAQSGDVDILTSRSRSSTSRRRSTPKA